MSKVVVKPGPLSDVLTGLGVIDEEASEGIVQAVMKMQVAAEERGVKLPGVLVVVDSIEHLVAMYPIEGYDESRVARAKASVAEMREDDAFGVSDKGSVITLVEDAGRDNELLTTDELFSCCVALVGSSFVPNGVPAHNLRLFAEMIAFSDPGMLGAMRNPVEDGVPTVLLNLIREVGEGVRFSSFIVQCAGRTPAHGSREVH